MNKNCRSDIVLKFRLSGTCFLRFCDQDCFEFQILKGLKNLNFSPGSTFVIADHECVKMSSFAILHMNLWPKEDNVFNKPCALE